MSSTRNWQSKSDLGLTWNPKYDDNRNPRWVAGDEDYIEGVYMDRQDDIGQYNSTVYKIDVGDGVLRSVWGDSVLNSEMAKYKFGAYLKIKFEGRKLKKDFKAGTAFTDKNSFWNWTVYYDANESPVNVAAPSPAEEALSPSIQPQGNNGFASAMEDDGLPF